MADLSEVQHITSSPVQLNQYSIMLRRAEYLEAEKELKKVFYRTGAMDLYLLKACYDSLFRTVQINLREEMKKSNEEGYKKLKTVADSNLSGEVEEEYEQLRDAFEVIDEWLFKKGLTKFATKKDIPSWDIEGRNKGAGV